MQWLFLAINLINMRFLQGHLGESCDWLWLWSATANHSSPPSGHILSLSYTGTCTRGHLALMFQVSKSEFTSICLHLFMVHSLEVKLEAKGKLSLMFVIFSKIFLASTSAFARYE